MAGVDGESDQDWLESRQRLVAKPGAQRANPTPWTVRSGYEQNDPGIYIADANGGVVLTGDDSDCPLTKALAERIVAAVNRERDHSSAPTDPLLALRILVGEKEP